MNGLRWQIRSQLVTLAAERILSDPDGCLAERMKILKAGLSSTVGACDGFVLKRYNFRKWGNPAKDLFRSSRARRAFRKAYHLELAGIPTARPIASADRRVLGLPIRSYFVMEEIRGAVDPRGWKGDPRHAIQAAGALLARLHNEGFSHRDLKETNILFDPQQCAFLIDLEGLSFQGIVAPARAQADLSRLARGLERMPGFGETGRAELIRHYEQLRHRLSL
jgi:tRNA A-37 threonylcarbamoyl transferase component Bud32